MFAANKVINVVKSSLSRANQPRRQARKVQRYARKGLQNAQTRAFINAADHYSIPGNGPEKSSEAIEAIDGRDVIETDVVVIGGGSIGLSVQYHLLRQGVNATLVEADELSSGTTWHTAGMVWSINPSDVYVEMIDYTKKMIESLQTTTDEAIWTQNGGLFLANSPNRLEELQRLKVLGNHYGIHSHILHPNEIHDIHPIVDATTTLGGLYSPTDGTVDPTALTNAFRKEIRKLNGDIYTKEKVVDIIHHAEVSNGQPIKRVTGVITNKKIINASCVVNATGSWSNHIMGMVGESVPLRTIKHAYVTTETIDGMKGTFPNVRDLDLCIYLRTQGTAMSVGGYEEHPDFWKPAPDFHFGLFDLDFDTFEENYTNAIHRCPQLGDVGLQSTVCGPESFTPDHKPLVGFHPGVRGLFQACGLNSMGILLSGGIGEQCSNWITTGVPTLDMFSMDVTRFHAAERKHDGINAMTAEAYHKTYATHYKHDEPTTGRGKRTSPLYEALKQQGCFFEHRHGFERPGWFNTNNIDVPYNELLDGELTFGKTASYDAIHKECFAARTGCVVIDQSYLGKIIISGQDADECVAYLCTNNPTTKPDNAITYTTLCNDAGGVEADLTVLKYTEPLMSSTMSINNIHQWDEMSDGMYNTKYYFSTAGSQVQHDNEFIMRTLEKQFPDKDVVVSDLTDDFAVLSIQGPLSLTLLNRLVQDDIDIEFSTSTTAMIGDVPVRIFRLTFVGELGYELLVPRDKAVEVYESITRYGNELKKETRLPFMPAGYRAVSSLSAEKGYRHWHADVTNVDTPMEALLGFTVRPRLKSGCTNFSGGPALNQHMKDGLKKKLVAFSVDGHERFQGLETIKRNDRPVGLVKFTEYGHTIDKTLCYGYVAVPEDDASKLNKKWLQGGEWTIQDIPVDFY